jgi:hypothetical protein
MTALQRQYIVGAVWLVLSMLTSVPRQLSSAELDHNDSITGCWTGRWATPKGNYNQTTRCFLVGGYWHGWYLEGDEKLAGDFEGRWRFKDDKTLVIDGKDCVLKKMTPGQAMVLANCPQAGEWLRDREQDARGK